MEIQKKWVIDDDIELISDSECILILKEGFHMTIR